MKKSDGKSSGTKRIGELNKKNLKLETDNLKLIEKLTLQLRERQKELNCQNELSKILENHTLNLDEVFKKFVNILPKSFLYEDRAEAMIIAHCKK